MRRRARFFAFVALVVFLAIAGRLFYLQVIQGDAFFRLTSDSIVHTDLCPPCAGRSATARAGCSRRCGPSYNLYVTPRLLTSEAFARLRAVLGMNGDEAMDVWERVQTGGADGAGPHAAERPVLLAEDISREAMAAIETGVDVPGVKIVSVPRRSYPQGALAAHVARVHERGLGRRAAREEGRGLPRRRSHRPHGHRAPVGGLPARPRRLPEDRRRPPRACPRPTSTTSSTVRRRRRPSPGNNVVLTIDADTQRIAERALRNASAAAVVVLDVDTGRVLAMVSKPGFDPNEMSGHLTADAQQRMLTDRFHPLRDKTLGRDLLPGLDVQADLGARGARGPARHARGRDQVPRVVRDRAAALPLHEDPRRGRALRRHRAELQRLLLRAGRAARHDGPPREVRRRPGPRRAHRPRPQRRGGRLPADGGVVSRAEAREPEGRGLPGRPGAQRRHRAGLDARDAAADGAALRGDRERRQAVAAADRRPRRGARRPGARGVRRRACGARSPVSPENLAFVRQALVGVVNEPKGTAYKARSRTSRSRARRARRRCTAATPSTAATRRASTPGSSASRPRGARRSRSRCWSSTAATAATSRRPWPWRSSTTTSTPSRPPTGTRRGSGCRRRRQP